MPDQVWVLWWRYSDGTESGVFRAYADEARAEEDRALLDEANPSKTFKIEPVPLLRSNSSR